MRPNESGFTLIEALIAMVVLAVGLIAVTNLLVVGAASNTIGNHATNTTTIATETLERLRNIQFPRSRRRRRERIDLPHGRPTCDDNVVANNCVRPGNFQHVKDVSGVGRVHTTLGDRPRRHADALHPRALGERRRPWPRRRARAEFTTIRSCTAVSLGCP